LRLCLIAIHHIVYIWKPSKANGFTMNYKLILALILILSANTGNGQQVEPVSTGNRAPIRKNPYNELPLGAITAEGWLLEMLLRQKNGCNRKPRYLIPAGNE
jgi:hypothetical protein